MIDIEEFKRSLEDILEGNDPHLNGAYRRAHEEDE